MPWVPSNRRARRYTTSALGLVTLEWVTRFQHHRLLESIGRGPPAEFEDTYYRELAESAMSA